MKPLILLEMPSKDGSIYAGGSGLELVRLLNDIDMSADVDCDLRTIMPKYEWLDPLLDMNKTEAGATAINGQYVHARVIIAIQNLLRTLPKEPDRLIIGMGRLPLLAFCGELSITSWRGSFIQTAYGKFIPTFSVQDFMKVWSKRWFVVKDFQRVLPYKDTPFPSIETKYEIDLDYPSLISRLNEIVAALDKEKRHIACDIETFRRSQISVLGLALSETDVIVINFIDFLKPKYSRWTVEEETQIILCLRNILTHPNVEVSGQNFHYDIQYIAKQWGFYPRYIYDSMHMFHCLYPGELPKDLATLSSLYSTRPMYWKDEGKEIHDAIKTKEKQDAYLLYNAKDCAATWIAVEKLKVEISAQGLQAVWAFQQKMFWPLAKTMLRGCRYDGDKQLEWRFQFLELKTHYEGFLSRVIPEDKYFPTAKKGSSPWYNSPKKTAALLYDIFKLPIQRNKKTKQPSTEDKALQVLMKKEVAIAPLLRVLLDYRSLGVFLSTFLSPSPDIIDKKMRTFYNLSGTETFRLSSKGDVYGTGQNLQNVPKGD